MNWVDYIILICSIIIIAVFWKAIKDAWNTDTFDVTELNDDEEDL